ncbi:MAG: DHHA1 domain-containing protein [Pigmentiphaga sp.]|nr:DHHA1 domain-containing protein [Pigmentiphaga sp.]
MDLDPFDLVIYHGNCYDGFAAAWAARLHSPDAEFIPAQYGDDPPDVAGKRVLICDFSYPRDVLLRMRADAAYLLVLDHHKTAQADLEGLGFCVFDMNRSGAGITWDTLHGSGRIPLIDHVEDRDLWRFKLVGTREYHAALSTIPFDFKAWDEFESRPFDEVVNEGAAVLRYHQLTCQKLAARARIGQLGEHQVWMVNAPVEFVSEVAEVLKHREPHLPVLGWSWDGERGNYYCSLRSREDGPDVSAIAREFGGGGHEHAAGFRCDRVPVDRVAKVESVVVPISNPQQKDDQVVAFRAPNHDLVDELERMLAEANEGRLRGLLFVTYRNGTDSLRFGNIGAYALSDFALGIKLMELELDSIITHERG